MPYRVLRRCRLECGMRHDATSPSCGKDWACCKALGKFGLSSCGKRRGVMMSASWLLAFLQFLLALCSLASVGTQEHTVMNLAWTIGESDTQQMFVGLEAMVRDTDSTAVEVVKFANEDCIENFCSLCHDSAATTVTVVSVIFLLTIPPLVINYKRASRKLDQNSLKFWSMVLPLLGLVACIVALSSFLEGCYYHLPQADVEHANITWVVGPGAVCLLASLLLKPVDIIMHMLVPVGGRGDEEDEEEDVVDSSL